MSGTTGRNLLRGIARIARFRPDGLADIGDDAGAVATSLIPLAVLPLAGSLIALMNGAGWYALRDLFIVACALLAPLVVTHALARAWGREALWPRFAAAFNWCQWAIPVAAMGLLLGAAVLVMLGLPTETSGLLVLLGVLVYALSLHWFVARHALRLSGAMAALLVVLTNLGTLACLAVPRLIAGALG